MFPTPLHNKGTAVLNIFHCLNGTHSQTAASVSHNLNSQQSIVEMITTLMINSQVTKICKEFICIFYPVGLLSSLLSTPFFIKGISIWFSYILKNQLSISRRSATQSSQLVLASVVRNIIKTPISLGFKG